MIGLGALTLPAPTQAGATLSAKQQLAPCPSAPEASGGADDLPHPAPSANGPADWHAFADGSRPTDAVSDPPVAEMRRPSTGSGARNWRALRTSVIEPRSNEGSRSQSEVDQTVALRVDRFVKR
jgi:hypothetical protein